MREELEKLVSEIQEVENMYLDKKEVKYLMDFYLFIYNKKKNNKQFIFSLENYNCYY